MMKRIVISFLKNEKGARFQEGVRKVMLLIWTWQTIFAKKPPKTKIN